jgi:hypothetical protein
LYEGRGDGVLGAHFSGTNSGTMGVCVIGNFETATPTNQAIDMLQDLIAWEATDKNIDVLAQSTHNASGLYLYNISGHRDSGSGTACPGDNLYNMLPSIRTAVSNYPCYNGNSTPPQNDTCNQATLLVSQQNCNYTSGTLDNATSSGLSVVSCDNFSNPALEDVFFSFTAVENEHTIFLEANPNLDPVIALYEGNTCNNLNEIFCTDSGGLGVNETIQASGLTVGETYWIRVYDYGSIPPTDGNFQICITHNNQTDISELSLIHQIIIYPNPVDENLVIKQTDNISLHQIIIINELGQTVKEIFNPKKTINVSDLSSGLYFINFITSNNKRLVLKMIKK